MFIVTNPNQSLVKSELHYYFIRLMICYGLCSLNGEWYCAFSLSSKSSLPLPPLHELTFDVMMSQRISKEFEPFQHTRGPIWISALQITGFISQTPITWTINLLVYSLSAWFIQVLWPLIDYPVLIMVQCEVNVRSH